LDRATDSLTSRRTDDGQPACRSRLIGTGTPREPTQNIDPSEEDNMDPTSTAAAAARATLESERDRLKRARAGVEGELEADGPITRSGDAGADTTTADEDRALRAGIDRQLAEVDAALQRIEEGTYGVDELTGESIDPARLEADPTARRNV
jgi:DnaK suppressor protein